jgi:hypothetical protein
MPSLWELGAASTVASVGIALLLAAAVCEPLRRNVRLGPPITVCITATAAAGMFVAWRMTLAALLAVGVAMAAGAVVLAGLRARPDDDDSGGGPGGPTEPGPEPPDGDGLDWERFEAAFWEHVARERVAR